MWRAHLLSGFFTMRMRKPHVNACFQYQSDLADERATLEKFMKHSSTSDKKVFTFREAQALYCGLLLSIRHGSTADDGGRVGLTKKA